MSIGSQDIERKRKSNINQRLYSGKNLRNLTLYNLNLDIINVNVYTKFGKILSIGSQDIDLKQNSIINQGPYLCWKFEENVTLYNPNLDQC